ncbi:hypothetical protein GCM10012285_16080 [Streptomyces kronopolitis]|uniref:Uncharacterized protein n=1 Tax=Streptomyces kronopolitis TaxID=1612435 RepID=A0ABQ2J7I2_9ACTN|nr:hypothetical protein GCM10012285_16080 [Streptomyces kronopolitis]
MALVTLTGAFLVLGGPVFVVSAELFVGSLALMPFVLGLVTVAVLAVLLLFLVRPVLTKTRDEDVPAALVALSQIIASLSCLLPWGKWRPSAQDPAAAAQREVSEPGRSATSTATIVTENLMVVRPRASEGTSITAQLSVAPQDREGGVGSV